MQNVTFNIPPKTGAELSYIEKAIESNKICGDGEFTKKCSQWMENAFSAKKVLLTGKRAILVCGTGIGMSIAANRFKGIRASHCTDTFTARMTRMHNDSNILCLGERITGTGLALDIVEIWLNTDFQAGRHERRISKLEL